MRKITFCFLGVISFSLAFFSCSINGTNWDVDAVGPVMETTLDFSKMVGDEHLDVASDSALTLHIVDTVYRFSLDTLSRLPLEDIVYSYTWPFAATGLPPGFTLPVQSFPINLDFQDIDLLFARIKSGTINIDAKSFVNQRLKFRYYIPSASKSGNPFEVTGLIDASVGGDTSYYSRVVDAVGYYLDLRGQNFTQVNRLDVYIEVQVDPDGDTLNLSTGQYLFEIRNTFKDLVPSYGKGYLGQYEFAAGVQTVDLEFMRRFKSGYVDLDAVTLDLKFINRLGADLRFQPSMLIAENTRLNTNLALSHSVIGSTINISRATETGVNNNPVNPVVYPFHFDAGNSNLKDLIEILPDKINIDADLYLNPLQNTSGYEDFFYYDFPSLLTMDLVAPLKFAINDVVFVDTLDNFLFDQEQIDHVISGEVKVLAENKFPLNAKLQVYTLDASGTITDSLLVDHEIVAASVNNAGRVVLPVQSAVNLVVTESKLQSLKFADRLLLKAFFVTLPSGQLLQMYQDYYLKLKLVGDIRYNIEL